jgi:hypothetical protein
MKAIPRVASSVNPIIRIVHLKLKKQEDQKIFNTNYRDPYPTSSMSLLAMMGRMVPPIEDPTATKPIAIPSFFLNQCETTADNAPKSPYDASISVNKANFGTTHPTTQSDSKTLT